MVQLHDVSPDNSDLDDDTITDIDLGLVTSLALVTIQASQRALSRLARVLVHRRLSRDLPVTVRRSRMVIE